MRRKFGEALLSVGAVGVILLVLVLYDERVREQFTLRTADPAMELSRMGQQASALSTVLLKAAHDQSMAHAPMLIFVFAAAVLTLFMLKT